MPSLTARIVFFLSAYSPLLIIISLRAFSFNKYFSGVIFLVAISSIIILWTYIFVLRRNPDKFEIEVTDFSRKDEEILSYLVVYLIPFLDISISNITDVLTIVVFMLVLGYLFINSDLIFINPVLGLFGYHLYEITYKSPSRYGTETDKEDVSGSILITSRNLVRVGQKLSVEQTKNNIFWET